MRRGGKSSREGSVDLLVCERSSDRSSVAALKGVSLVVVTGGKKRKGKGCESTVSGLMTSWLGSKEGWMQNGTRWGEGSRTG
jgi:hypothetical protein